MIGTVIMLLVINALFIDKMYYYRLLLYSVSNVNDG